MRFHANGPSIPDVLLQRRDAGRVVFLCGAGVSAPSGMPDFVGLTRHVVDHFGPPEDSEIMAAFQPWLAERSPKNVPLDQIFNLLHSEYGKNEVNALVTARLTSPLKSEAVSWQHSLIKRISSSQSGIPQIVTTNFDLLFELSDGVNIHSWYAPPAFPDLDLGSSIEGVTYLHGRLVDTSSTNHPYVLSSADFGRAYLSQGWATTFIRNLLQHYTVVLVGYQAEDPPVKYLLQGLNHDGMCDRSNIYAFDRGSPEQIEAKWRDRGVTAIAYAEHADLWQAMEVWAVRADDSRAWRTSIISRCHRDPKSMEPHERGQVAHLLRTVQGARSFLESHPRAHPEWICVLDPSIRLSEPAKGYERDAESFDPIASYGLDDDLPSLPDINYWARMLNESVLSWKMGDDSPNDLHRLVRRNDPGYESTPTRLSHIISWVAASIDSPVIAWWVARQNGLHPKLLYQLELKLESSETLSEKARHIWTLVLEQKRDPRSGQWNGEWFDFIRRLNTEGWTASVLRDFTRVSTPRIEVKLPYGIAKSKPPSASWEELHLLELGDWEVLLLERNDQSIEIPDSVLPKVVRILEEQLIATAGLLDDIGDSFFRSPTCYPSRDIDAVEERVDREGIKDAVTWFFQLFEVLAAKLPKIAHSYAENWQSTEKFFFRKLKLYALGLKPVFTAASAAEELLSYDQLSFWEIDIARELLYLIVDRWLEYSDEDRRRLVDRILLGPDYREHWSHEDFPAQRREFSARYARYLQLQGCELPAEHCAKVSELINSISDWDDRRASATVEERAPRAGWFGTDEAPDAIIDLPASKVVAKSKEVSGREFSSLTERRPFNGLVKANPRKALAALTISGKAGDYPDGFWSALVSEFPMTANARLKRVFLCRLARIPKDLAYKLRHSLGRWLEANLAEALNFDESQAWSVYDHTVDSVMSRAEDATRSSLGEVRIGGRGVRRSRRTMDHAMNGPVGMYAEALFKAMARDQHDVNSLLPDHIKTRLSRLFTAPGEGADHAVAVACRHLIFLMHVDPEWTRAEITSFLEPDHAMAEPAWNGLLTSQRPSKALRAEIIPVLLRVFPWIETLCGNEKLPRIAAEWMCIFRISGLNEAEGISQAQMRSALRVMSDETRNRLILWLQQVGEQNDKGWTKHVIPFITSNWPRERRYRTSASVRAWIRLLGESGDFFPTVLEVVKPLLVPVELEDYAFYRFTRSSANAPLADRFPEAALELLNIVTPATLSRPPLELPKLLSAILNAKQELAADRRYLRLVDLIERS